MANPNLDQFTIQPHFVVDPKSDQSHNSNMSTRSLNHGPDVNNEDLGFWGSAINPTQSGQQQFPGGLDPGAMVYVLKGLGQSGGVILGLANAMRNGNASSGAGGGVDLMAGAVQELINTTIDVNIPPQIQESEERGAKVRTIKEKGTQHSLGALDGLPNHGALFNMSGFRLPAVKNVPTAKQHNDKMMTGDIFGQLEGQITSIGQMLQGLMQNGSGGGGGSANSGGGLGNGQSYWQDIHDVLTPNMSTALTSLSNLIQGHETDNGVGYVTGGVVHYGIYLENAAQLLAQVQSIDDLMNVLQRLQFDTSLMGLDQLNNTVIQIENAWGTALQEVDYNGTITVTYANTNAQSNFANTAFNPSTGGSAAPQPPSSSGSGSGSGSGSSGFGALFGTASQVMQDMWKRLAMTQEQDATQMYQQLTQGQGAQVVNQVNQTTANGGDVGDTASTSGSFSVTTQ